MSAGHSRTLPPALDPLERRRLEANIRKFYLFRFLVNLQFWLPIWVTYLTDERGLSLSQVTALDAPFWLVLVVMEVPTGAIADRYGRKVSLYWGALAHAIAVLVFAVGTNYPILLASYLAWGIAFTLFSGADAAFLFDSLKTLGREHEYPRVFGRSAAAMSAGSILGTLLGAPLAAFTNLWFPILISAVFLFAAFAVSLTFREPPRPDDGHHAGYWEGIRAASRLTWRVPSVRYVIGLSAVLGAAASTIFIFNQPFLSRHGVDVGNFGWFLVMGQLAGMLTSIFAYRVIDLLGMRRLLVLLPIAVLCVTFGLGMFDTIGAFAFIPLNSAIYALMTPAISTYLNVRVSSAARATILSLQNLVLSLLLAGFEPIAGFVADARGLPASYQVAGLLVAIAGAPMLALWLRADRGAVAAGVPAAAVAVAVGSPDG